MTFLAELWMPILVAAVFVFIVSSIIHVALPIHKNDYTKMDGEDAVIEAIQKSGVKPGQYIFPYSGSMKEFGTPEMQEKMKNGPVGWLTVAPPNGLHMNKSLVEWFIQSIVIGILVGYVGWHALGAGATFMETFQITGTTAIMAYALGYLHDPIWKGGSWSAAIKFMIDGLIYGLITGATFGWLWPAAGV